MAKKHVRIPETVREDIIRRIRAGEFRCDIARACQVSDAQNAWMRLQASFSASVEVA